MRSVRDMLGDQFIKDQDLKSKKDSSKKVVSTHCKNETKDLKINILKK